MTTALVVVGGNPFVLMLVLNLLQEYFYLMLFNVRFPEYLPPYFQSFSFARLDFL